MTARGAVWHAHNRGAHTYKRAFASDIVMDSMMLDTDRDTKLELFGTTAEEAAVRLRKTLKTRSATLSLHTIKLDQTVIENGLRPSRVLCGLLAQLLKLTPNLRVLHLCQAGFHGADVLAALCSKGKSSLTDLWLCVGVVEPMEDCSVLEPRLMQQGSLTSFTLTGCQNLGIEYPPLYIAAVQGIIHKSAATLSSLNLDSPHVEPFFDAPPAYFKFPNLREVTAWDNCFRLPCFEGRRDSVTTVNLHFGDRNRLFEEKAMYRLARQFPSVKEASLHLDGAVNAEELAQMGTTFVFYMLRLQTLCITDPEPKCSATHLVCHPHVEDFALMEWRENGKCRRLERVLFNHSGTVISRGVREYREVERRWDWDGYWRCKGYNMD